MARSALATALAAACVVVATTRSLHEAAPETASTSKPPFDWGVATAAYQVEGGAKDGGRGASIWDTFSKGAGDVAIDFYHKYKDDIALMQSKGVKKFRMSISWPRIQPSGTGPANKEGLAFYTKVFDALEAAGIEPWVTLYHWDLPQALQDKYGGWTSPKIVDDFAAYADIVFSEFGSRIKHWSTFNEPRTFCTLGYGLGIHAPGIKSVESAWKCVQHVLEAHAAAFKHFKAKVPGGDICMNLDGEWGEPASDSADDKAAAQTHRDYHYGLFADPIYLGRYPQSIIDHAPAGLGTISPKLAADLKGSQTLYCFNGYTARWVKARKGATQPDGLGVGDYDGLVELNGKTIGPRGEPEWLYSVPWGFRNALVYLNKRYNPGNMAVTEFGIACPNEDNIGLPAVLKDTCRVDYYRDYIKAAEEAKAQGAPISVVFPWSFSDNLEWAEGYKQRFGLTYVDYKTQTRYPKESFDYVSQLWGNPKTEWPLKKDGAGAAAPAASAAGK